MPRGVRHLGLVLLGALALALAGCERESDVRADWTRELRGVDGIERSVDVGCQEEFPGSLHDCRVTVRLSSQPTARTLDALLERYVAAASKMPGGSGPRASLGSLVVQWRRDGAKTRGTPVTPDRELFEYRFDAMDLPGEDTDGVAASATAIAAFVQLAASAPTAVRGASVVDSIVDPKASARGDVALAVGVTVPWSGVDTAWDALPALGRSYRDADRLTVESYLQGERLDDAVRGVRFTVGSERALPTSTWRATRSVAAAWDETPVAIVLLERGSGILEMDIGEGTPTDAELERRDRLQAAADAAEPAGVSINVMMRDLDRLSA